MLNFDYLRTSKCTTSDQLNQKQNVLFGLPYSTVFKERFVPAYLPQISKNLRTVGLKALINWEMPTEWEQLTPARTLVISSTRMPANGSEEGSGAAAANLRSWTLREPWQQGDKGTKRDTLCKVLETAIEELENGQWV